MTVTTPTPVDPIPVEPQPSTDPPAPAPEKPAKKQLLPLLLVIGLILVLSALIVARQMTKPANQTETQQTATSPTTVPLEWKTYSNTEAGFTFKYPGTIRLEADPEDESKMTLSVSVEKLSDIPESLPSLLDRKSAIDQKERLAKGEGEDLIKIGSLYGETSTILAQFEVCSVLFTRRLTFYPLDFRVFITLSAPKDGVITGMPDFFTTDPANCGTQKVWNREKLATFETDLADKKGKGLAQEWFDTFSAITDTITLTKGQPTPSPLSNLKTYKNDQYGFTVLYPPPYRPVTDADSLSAYPNGIVLLYTGGQAYDIIIEAWNTQKEYEDNYSSRLSELTVRKIGDKFITLFDNTGSSENATIIASFKP